jgi:hypothetical protein
MLAEQRFGIRSGLHGGKQTYRRYFVNIGF